MNGNITNLAGKLFGSLTVISRATGIGKTKRVSWLCRCSCGKEKIVLSQNLSRGDTKSCGCKSWKNELIGSRFGRLTVMDRAESKRGATRWDCKCDCGKDVTVYWYALKRDQTKSCGCLAIENRTKHGLHKTRFYNIWCGIASRGKGNSRAKAYANVKICERWLTFENFKDDMYESYLKHVEEFGEKHTTIERKENSKGYELSNCVWATFIQIAISGKSGIIEIFEPTDNEHDSLSINNLGAKKIVASLKISTFCKENNVDLLKLDVEGCELDVIMDMIIYDIKPKIICLEIHKESEEMLFIKLLPNYTYERLDNTFTFILK